MKNLKKIIVLSSLSMASLASAQNYDYRSSDANDSNYSSPHYPSQSEYSSQPHSYSQSGQYRNDGYQGGDQRYSTEPQRANYQGEANKNQQDHRDKSFWSEWFGSKDETPQVPDQVIRNQIMRNLQETPYLSNIARNIQVIVKDGKVTLKGKATNKNESYMIEYMIKNVRGVRSVSNDLEHQRSD